MHRFASSFFPTGGLPCTIGCTQVPFDSNVAFDGFVMLLYALSEHAKMYKCNISCTTTDSILVHVIVRDAHDSLAAALPSSLVSFD